MVPLQWQSDDGQQSIGQLTIPGRGLTVFVVEAASGQVLADLPAGSAQLEVHKAGVNDPLGAPVVSQGQSAVVDGLTYTYQRNRQYTGLTVKQDSGSWVVGLGAALLILGCYLVFFMPHRRLWVRVRDTADGGSQVRLGAPLKRDPGFEPVFTDLVSTITRPDAPVGQTSKE
jgi:cytochrome c biogenesis protein